MAQQANQYAGSTTVNAKNLGINSGSGETTVLEKIPCLGSKNLSVTIVNYSGSISAVALYGSPDGENWLAVSGFSSFTVSAGNVGHAEVTAVWPFIRVTTTGTAVIDAYFNAV